jgi:hypothetical protein
VLQGDRRREQCGGVLGKGGGFAVASLARHLAREWAALYTQLRTSHAHGTLPYRFDMGYTRAVLDELTLSGVGVRVIASERWHDGSVGGDAKAAAIKRA